MDPPQKGGMGVFVGNTTRKAYDKETFASLVECCSRLFCCDEEIVITDLLLAAEKAISERDIEAELGISERKVHEFMIRMERHGLVNRVTTGQVSDILSKPQRQPRSAREVLQTNQHHASAQSFWRLSSYFILVVHYKLTKMEETLQERRRSLQECDRFICPACSTIYDSLEVQKLEMDGFDAHFICYCGVKVELDDKEAKDSVFSSQQHRCEEQVKTLKKCLTAAWGMEVPQFPIYVRGKEKASEKAPETSTTETAPSTAEAASSVVSGYSGTSDGSNTTTPHPVVKSLLSDVSQRAKTIFSGRSETGKIKFHMRGASSKPSKAAVTTSSTDKVSKVPVMAAESREAVPKTGSQPAETPAPLEPCTVEKEEDITFYIEKLGRSFSLAEAQDHQKHMNNEEFERFLELQERYLNFI